LGYQDTNPDLVTDKPGVTADGLMNHYDPVSGRCFMLVSSTLYDSDSIAGWHILSDAFERKIFGECHWDMPKSGFYVYQVGECYVIQPSGEEIDCYSEKEFYKLVTAYMGPIPMRN
jgi:hypothetical protein